jgi:hypothetical protein
MNIWQIGFAVRSGVSALVVAFLLGYAAHYQWGLSRVEDQFLLTNNDHYIALRRVGVAVEP